MTFRAAERADAEAIAELIRAYDRANGGEIGTDAGEMRDDWTSPGFELDREPVGALVGHALRAGGFVRLLGVRSPWRRRGLGLTLLRRSFGSFWERGRRYVALAVDTKNPTGAPRLYVAAGMYETHRNDRWEKGA